MGIEFQAAADEPGVTVVDPIQQRRVRVGTRRPVEPTARSGEFVHPVDTCCVMEATLLSFDFMFHVGLLEPDGTVGRDLSGQEQATFDPGTTLGINGPIKLFVRPGAGGVVRTDLECVEIDLEERCEVQLGARSHHERPAATIETTTQPRDMMQAVGALSSSLKTTSPDRSWPTLRGHPPLLEVGSSLSIPNELAAPAEDIWLECPPRLGPLYTLAPLAYYLGAPLRPGDEPAIHTDGCRRPLGVDRSLPAAVARILGHVFFLDCVVREAGVYQIDLEERTRVREHLPATPQELFEAPVGHRFEHYDRVPHDVVEPHRPAWPLTAHIPAEAETVSLVPFVLNELGLIRPPEVIQGEDAERTRAGGFTRSANGAVSESATPDTTGTAQGADRVFEVGWAAPDLPQGSTRLLEAAYRNQLSSTPADDEIGILVVCNDGRMIDEQSSLTSIYGTRTNLPYDVTSAFGTGTEELAALLEAGGYDYLHYVGHAEPDGLVCHDGLLDCSSLADVDLSTFFLNACASHDQGVALVEAGAYGGVCTFEDVPNDRATVIGERVARLLNLGFPLRGAVDVGRRYEEPLDGYVLVGDGGATVVQTDGGVPMVLEATSTSNGCYDCSILSYPTRTAGVGSVMTELVTGENRQFLHPGRIDGLSVSAGRLTEFLTWTQVPVVLDGDLYWNAEYLETDVAL